MEAASSLRSVANAQSSQGNSASRSLVSTVATAVIAGLGPRGYPAAIRGLIELLSDA